MELPRSPLLSLLYRFPFPQLKPAADSTPSTTAKGRAEDDNGEAQGTMVTSHSTAAGRSSDTPRERSLSFSTADLLSLRHISPHPWRHSRADTTALTRQH